MSAPNPSTALARVVVDELVRQGLRLVVLSPGSRSAALAIAAAESPQLETVMFLDERSASFYALGAAKATGVPSVVLATSGTAPANWFPAVVEADASGTPMLLISADRPARLRGVGANQTIDQVEMFGNRVRLFADVAAPDGSDRVGEWRKLVGDAIRAAQGGMPGPVHLNIAFEEPTVPVSDDGRSRADAFTHQLDVEVDAESGPTGLVEAKVDIAPTSRGLVVAGDGAYSRHGLLEQAHRLGWPVLATATSGLRGEAVVAHYGAILKGMAETPELVVSVGATGPNEMLDSIPARTHFRVDQWGRNIDPNQIGALQVKSDPVAFLAGVDAVTEASGAEPSWSRWWLDADSSIAATVEGFFGRADAMTGPEVAWRIGRVSAENLVVASSLPIRDIDAYWRGAARVVANRGASGIDGFASTALGASRGRSRTLAVSGDLSLFHDNNGWMNDGDHDLTMVVVNNHGGGLFDLLPQRTHAPHFERLFIAPQNRDVAELARFHRLGYTAVATGEHLEVEIETALSRGGLNLIEVAVDRDYDLEARSALAEVASKAIV